jgi:hypothetical protein
MSDYKKLMNINKYWIFFKWDKWIMRRMEHLSVWRLERLSEHFLLIVNWFRAVANNVEIKYEKSWGWHVFTYKWEGCGWEIIVWEIITLTPTTLTLNLWHDNRYTHSQHHTYMYTVKPLLLNTPSKWSPCYTEHPPVPRSEFCWFWPPPIWSPRDSECERFFSVPAV